METRENRKPDIEESQRSMLENIDVPDSTRVYTIDGIFKDLGRCHKFQRIFFPLAYSPMLPSSWCLYFMLFGSYNPGWRCYDNVMFNSTNLMGHSNNFAMSNTHDNYSKINNETSMSSCDVVRLCNNLTFSDEASTIVTEWALVCDDSWIPSFIFTVQIIGVFLGVSVFGYIGDRFGRKLCIHGSSVFLAITNFIAIFSVSWKMYAIIKFFIGFGAGGIIISVIVYTLEFIPAWWRAFVGTFPFWNLSNVLFSLCVLAVRDWRHVHIAIVILSLVVLLPVFWLPESLRFLTVHGKLERANEIVSKIARINRKPLPDTSIMKTVAETEKTNMKDRSNYSYLDLFRKSVRKETLVLGMTWFTLSFATYMIGFGLKNLSGDFFLNFFLYCFLGFLIRLLGPVLITKMGRKHVLVVFLFLSCICSFTVAAVQLLASGDAQDLSTLIFALGANTMSQAAFGPAVVLCIELFPTGIRNMASSYCSALARIGSLVAPFLLPKENLPIYGSFILLGCLQIIIILSVLTLSESKDKPLPDNM